MTDVPKKVEWIVNPKGYSYQISRICRTSVYFIHSVSPETTLSKRQHCAWHDKGRSEWHFRYLTALLIFSSYILLLPHALAPYSNPLFRRLLEFWPVSLYVLGAVYWKQSGS